MSINRTRSNISDMLLVRHFVRRLIDLRPSRPMTLLAVCPNSAVSLEAAVLAAVRSRAPMLFAATLNQVDVDGGYTGWTPHQFTEALRRQALRHRWRGPLVPCLDHGGPWLKDQHRRERWSLEATTDSLFVSLRACLSAGYRLLHIDATVDITLPPSSPVPIDRVVERTISLIRFCEAERAQIGLPPIDYEVGTEEVHGGLVDEAAFAEFLALLRQGLEVSGLIDCWPCFIVGKVGTDLDTTFFDPSTAHRLHDMVAPFGSLIKGHYTDWVANPQDYPASGMGGANLGPELTREEVRALAVLESEEVEVARRRPSLEMSGFGTVLESAVIASGRWTKWLRPDEIEASFADLAPERRAWLVETGARYVWALPEVLLARRRLYDNLRRGKNNPHQRVVERVARVVDRYIAAFNLVDSIPLFEQ